MNAVTANAVPSGVRVGKSLVWAVHQTCESLATRDYVTPGCETMLAYNQTSCTGIYHWPLTFREQAAFIIGTFLPVFSIQLPGLASHTICTDDLVMLQPLAKAVACEAINCTQHSPDSCPPELKPHPRNHLYCISWALTTESATAINPIL